MRLFQLISALLFGIILSSCELFAQEYVYVCNQNSASITVIDVESLEIEETISLQELGFQQVQNLIMLSLSLMVLTGMLV